MTKCFETLAKKNETALIPYVTAGLPTAESTVRLMHEMVDSGANLIELGIPFSDPMADGPIIQQANEKALRQGITLPKVLDIVFQFRQKDQRTPIILMGYLNPIEQMGYIEFAEQATSAGVDGVITVDLPPEESTKLRDVLKRKPLEIIYLIAPTTSEKRLEYISKISSSFIYYVSVKGITGSSNFDTTNARKGISKIRHLSNCPIGIGFGIKDKRSATNAAEVADAIIIGTALIEKIDNDVESSITNIKRFLSSIKNSLENPNHATVTSNV
ncbi:Tryptophan synthase alpha chain [Nymphon striatum]|nr:Tryptophan synthase alpha chain [Nymphon striatum]